MSRTDVESALENLAGADGLLGCALVDIETGMVVHACGSDEAVRIAEAASDFWRLSRRHCLPFELLGKSRAQVLIHQRARLTLVECGRDLLLVSMSGEPDRVDWARWKREFARTVAAIAAT